MYYILEVSFRAPLLRMTVFETQAAFVTRGAGKEAFSFLES